MGQVGRKARICLGACFCVIKKISEVTDQEFEAASAYRPCAAMLLFNAAGEVLVAERNDMKESAWQLPQGGIDRGETAKQAALRELEEEIGTASAKIIAVAPNTVSYDWPANKAGRSKKWRGQCITLVALLFNGHDDDINLETDHPEFRNWKWVSLEMLPRLITPFKRAVYEYAVSEFSAVRDKLRQENP
jgi:putative (di)nucleoside polyphosphate hydrolase